MTEYNGESSDTGILRVYYANKVEGAARTHRIHLTFQALSLSLVSPRPLAPSPLSLSLSPHTQLLISDAPLPNWSPLVRSTWRLGIGAQTMHEGTFGLQTTSSHVVDSLRLSMGASLHRAEVSSRHSSSNSSSSSSSSTAAAVAAAAAAHPHLPSPPPHLSRPGALWCELQWPRFLSRCTSPRRHRHRRLHVRSTNSNCRLSTQRHLTYTDLSTRSTLTIHTASRPVWRLSLQIRPDHQIHILT